MIELAGTHTWVTAHVSSDPIKVKRLTNGPGSLHGAESAMCLFFSIGENQSGGVTGPAVESPNGLL